MKRLAAMAILSLVALSFGQRVIPVDCDILSHNPGNIGTHVLTAYKLSPAQAECFDPSNDDPAPFWAAWNQTILDSANIYSDDAFKAWGKPTGGKTDADITIKALWADAGVFLLFEVTDQEFVDILDQNAIYTNDAIEVYTERASAEELYSAPGSHFIGLDLSQITDGYVQFQIPFSGTTGSESAVFRYNQPSEGTLPGSNATPLAFVFYQNIGFLQAANEYNLKIKVLPAVQTNTRRQEWFIPWVMWGNLTKAGQFSVDPATANGRKLAFSFGYNDKDAGTAEACALRWRNAADAYQFATRNCNGFDVTTSLDFWGNLELGATLDATLIAAGKPALSCSSSVRIPNLYRGMSQNVKSTEYFTLSGAKVRAVAGKLVVPAGSIVIQKDLMTNGQVRGSRFIAK